MTNIEKAKYLLAAVALLSLVGCGGKSTGEGYGYTHNGYVSKATVTVKGDKIKEATLVEVCLPTYVQAAASVAAGDKVTVTVIDHNNEVQKTFYKTVKVADVTLTYDETAKDYKVGNETFVSWVKIPANAKTYFDAVESDNVAVVVNSKEDKTVLTNKALNKELNGYWTVDGASKWIANRDATIEFLVSNGMDALLATAINGDGFWATSDAVSGATWTDLNSAKDTHDSYAKVLERAYNNAK